MLTSTMFYKRFFVVDLKTVYSTRYQYVYTSLLGITQITMLGIKIRFFFTEKLKSPCVPVASRNGWMNMRKRF